MPVRIPPLPEQVCSSPSRDGRPCRCPQSGRADAVASVENCIVRHVHAGMQNPKPCAQGITGDEFVFQCGLGHERSTSLDCRSECVEIDTRRTRPTRMAGPRCGRHAVDRLERRRGRKGLSCDWGTSRRQSPLLTDSLTAARHSAASRICDGYVKHSSAAHRPPADITDYWTGFAISEIFSNLLSSKIEEAPLGSSKRGPRSGAHQLLDGNREKSASYAIPVE